MSVAKVTEISATSSKSFEDALEQGIVTATKTLGNVRSAWVEEQRVHVSNGSIVGYQIRMMVIFVIDDQRRRFRVQEERLDEDRANSMTDEGGPPRPGSSSAITALPLTASPSSSSSWSRLRGVPRRR